MNELICQPKIIFVWLMVLLLSVLKWQVQGSADITRIVVYTFIGLSLLRFIEFKGYNI
jgi:hypothetical protein